MPALRPLLVPVWKVRAAAEVGGGARAAVPIDTGGGHCVS